MTILLSTFTDWSQLHPYDVWYIQGVIDLMIILHTCGSYMVKSGLAKDYSMGKISFDNLDPLLIALKMDYHHKSTIKVCWAVQHLWKAET